MASTDERMDDFETRMARMEQNSARTQERHLLMQALIDSYIEQTDENIRRAHQNLERASRQYDAASEMIEIAGRAGSAFADEAVRRHERDQHDRADQPPALPGAGSTSET